METDMKTIGGFIFLIGATACAVCAAQTPPTSSVSVASAAPQTDAVPPRTLPSHPEPQSTASKPATPPKEYGGAYSGYRRVVADGQELYCRNDVATGSHTERKAVCLTQAQMRIEQLKAQQFMMDMQRRAGSERQLTYIYGANAGMQSSAR
jgi:hypothetical protein